MPKDSDNKTLGYAFIEYNTPQVTHHASRPLLLPLFDTPS
jgi:hypothetical protein